MGKVNLFVINNDVLNINFRTTKDCNPKYCKPLKSVVENKNVDIHFSPVDSLPSRREQY